MRVLEGGGEGRERPVTSRSEAVGVIVSALESLSASEPFAVRRAIEALGGVLGWLRTPDCTHDRASRDRVDHRFHLQWCPDCGAFRTWDPYGGDPRPDSWCLPTRGA
jgi:hypothetical protein